MRLEERVGVKEVGQECRLHRNIDSARYSPISVTILRVSFVYTLQSL